MNLMAPPRTIWRAVSSPAAFFASLDDVPRVNRAIVTLLVSALVASVVAAAMLLRASGSTALLPILLGVPVIVVSYLAQVSILGGLILVRPAGMDVRAFEVVLWAWMPSGVLAASLLPIGLLAPLPTLLGGALLVLPAWHLWIVWRGVEAFAVARPRLTMILYVIVVFVVPSLLLAFIALVLANVA